ncbi:MAG: efflux RND transporter permease subunit [Minwuia sp.]|uniref:efflux RND transporter permease subunit n=1 Tax=Minwuia sp. TaxID=2493630 RepID=UPI003A868CB2
MQAIIDAALSRARTVIATLLLILLAGIAAYISIPKESDPDINVPILYVSMTHDGISPEDAARLLNRPMEQELQGIEGLKEMRSIAADGFGSVVLEFDAGFDVDKAMDDVREKVDLAKSELPEDTDEPQINEVNFSLFPVLVVTLSGDMPERALFKVARDLQDRIEGLPNVLGVDMAGDRDEMLEILIDPAKLESYQIDQQELIRTMTANNRLVAAGVKDTGLGRNPIKVPALFKTAKDVLTLPIKTEGDAVVTLEDVATIRRTFKDVENVARLDGRPAVALEVKKRTGANIIDTIDQVKAVVGATSQGWPAGLNVTFSQDRSEQIRTMLTDLQNNVISAVLLVMIVVVAALGLRSALLVGVAIPGSFLIGILYLYIFGFTINIVVLFALILAVGMLVDGAIVVTEFADRKMSEGEHRKKAYGLAAKRMAWPIIASTATTLAAFMPLLFWPGVVGEFMQFLPLTLITTLSGSLLMALIFVPTLGSIFGKGSAGESSAVAMAETGSIREIPGFTGVYARFLSMLVRRPLVGPPIVVVLAVVSLIGVNAAYGVFGKGVEFFPDVEPEQALVYVHARGNLSIAEQDALVRKVENRILAFGDFDSVYTRAGKRDQDGNDISEDVIGIINLELKDWEERRPVSEIFPDIRQKTADIAGIVVEPRKPEAGPPTGKDIQVQITSDFREKLEPVAADIRAYLETVEGLQDIEDSRALPGIQWAYVVDRSQAGRFGTDVASIGGMIQFVTNGVLVDDYLPDDAEEDVEIRVRFPEEYRNLDQLEDLTINTPNGMVPISNFVTREPQPKVGTIERVDGKFRLMVKANVAEGLLVDDKVQEIKAWMDEQDYGSDIEIAFRGADEEQAKAEAFLGNAFIIALFIMGIILVTQFNSFYRAFLILTAVIMSTIGVMIGLLVMGQPFGIVMTGVGVISLAGIVVNNNIVLIDTYAWLEKSGMNRYEAIVRTGAQRLRPVLLTTVTTICGLMPMIFQANIDFFERSITVGAPSTQWWVQLASAVAFGLGFATILTLIVTPCLLALGARLGEAVSGGGKKGDRQQTPEMDLAPAE